MSTDAERAEHLRLIRSSPTAHRCPCGEPWSDSGYVGFLETYHEVVSMTQTIHYNNPIILLNNPWCAIRAVFASKPGSYGSLPGLWADPCFLVRRAMVTNPDTPLDVVEKMVADPDFGIREFLWEHPGVSQSVTDALSEEFA